MRWVGTSSRSGAAVLLVGAVPAVLPLLRVGPVVWARLLRLVPTRPAGVGALRHRADRDGNRLRCAAGVVSLALDRHYGRPGSWDGVAVRDRRPAGR